MNRWRATVAPVPLPAAASASARTLLQASQGDGSFDHRGRVSPQLDALIDATAVELSADQRDDRIRRALAEHNSHAHQVPPCRQVNARAMRSNVHGVHRTDTWLPGEWTRID